MSQSGSERGRGSAFVVARRVGLRVLAVAGLAGAAWLLSGSAAYAAEPTPEPAPVSVVGIVADLGEDLLGLESTQELLDQVLVPVPSTSTVDDDEKRRHASHKAHAVAGKPATDAPPVTTTAAADTVVGPLFDTVFGPAFGRARSFGLEPREGGPTILTRLIAPLGAVDLLRPVVQLTQPVVAPLNRTIDAIRDVLRFAATPVMAVLDAATRGSTGPVPDSEVRGSSVPVASIVDTTGATDAPDAPLHHRAATRPGAVTERVPALPGADQGGTSDVPAMPWPGDPLSGLLGLGTTGSPMSGPGSPHDSGSSALVPLTVSFGEVALHPLSLTTVVGLARQLAENPTVSPD